ncbi:hypothetical protein GCM10010329_80830 [Streptomyces spiroverticillatus]|uniref:Uncharacterized protein n=1 Tax=Streptomyces finlayi TaxID=67296 RepID=A0A919CFK1_9ACTN|nr:hypothetical protein [Streptomyces finlayi]GHA46039.1 hypothetical protein GCM10010329_80830 [Streptomyces spiroverticillatus]GHD16076.1 hypothetical protein GCM10010334_76750 [Streptomyces finlayi]
MTLSRLRRSAGIRSDWTAADYESQECLRQLGHRDAVSRVRQARRGHPVRHAARVLRARLTRRSERPAIQACPVDWDVARQAAEAVNRGDVDEATRLVEATDCPRDTAFAAFRFINVN